MKKLFLISSFLFTLTSYAQTVPDSTAVRQLEEVVVEGQTHNVGVEKSTYLVSKQSKEIARNGIDLIRLNSIPNLVVNPIDQSVTSLDGQSVSFFVNGQPAAEGEVYNLYVKDALRIEYLDFPTDPRFNGAQHVVNFIMKVYEYGGYTKLSTEEEFLIPKAGNISTVYSKFAYKKMSYDLYASHTYGYGKNCNGEESNEIITNPFTGQSEYRSSRSTGNTIKKFDLPITFRAAYQNDKIVIHNSLGANLLFMPLSATAGTINGSFLSQPTEFKQDNRTYQRSYTWNGWYFFRLQHAMSLSITPSFAYASNKSDRDYSTKAGVSIVNNIKEEALNTNLIISFKKNFNKKHNLSANIRGGYSYNTNDYTGNTVSNEYLNKGNVTGFVNYEFVNNLWRFQTETGYAWEGMSTHNITYDDSYPFIHINAMYSPNSRNRLALYTSYATFSPGLANFNPVVVQSNELQYYSGNDKLKDYRTANANISYVWLPTNWFNANLSFKYTGYYDRIITVYDYLKEKAMMLAYPVNNGNYHSYQLTAMLNFSLFNSSLVVQAMPSYRIQQSTGIYNTIIRTFGLSAGCYYSWKYLYAGATFILQGKELDSSSNYVIKSKNYLQMYLGFANNGWNIRLLTSNPYRNSYKSMAYTLSSPVFNGDVTKFDMRFHSTLYLSVEYSFGYGKEIDRRQEINRLEGPGSSVI